MAMKNDAKIGVKLTCELKIEMRNLTSFDSSTQKSQKLDFDGILLSKEENVSLKFTGDLLVMAIKMMQNWRRNWLAVSKLTWEIWQILTWALKNLKSSMSFFWSKYIMLELKSYRGFIFDDMKINAKFEGKLSNFRSQAEK